MLGMIRELEEENGYMKIELDAAAISEEECRKMLEQAFSDNDYLKREAGMSRELIGLLNKIESILEDIKKTDCQDIAPKEFLLLMVQIVHETIRKREQWSPEEENRQISICEQMLEAYSQDI
jgi:hypothetical protein